MKSPRVTGYGVSSAPGSEKGSTPSVSSSRATMIAMLSESRPESSSTSSSVSGGSPWPLSSATCLICAMTADLTDMSLLAMDDVRDQRAEQSDAFEQLRVRERRRQLELGVECAVQLLGMRHVADAVNVGVFHLRGSLALRQFGQIGHELLDESLEERHRDDDRHGREASDEKAHVAQCPRDRLCVAVGRQSCGGGGEAAKHAGVAVTHFLAQVVDDLRARRVGSRGEIRAGHPVDEITLEHRAVARDQVASLCRR